jgi:hypothetical protein
MPRTGRSPTGVDVPPPGIAGLSLGEEGNVGKVGEVGKAGEVGKVVENVSVLPAAASR